MFGQDDFTEPPPEPVPYSVVLSDVVGYTGDPGAIDYYGDASLYAATGSYGDASLYEAPNLQEATLVTLSDLGLHEPTAAEMVTVSRAIAETVATRDAGGDWQATMRGWGQTLSDTLRSALPAIVNRVLGRSPSGGVVVARPEHAGMNWTPLLVIGGILVVVTMLGAGSRGRATAGVPRALRQRRPHRRRSSGRRMRR